MLGMAERVHGPTPFGHNAKVERLQNDGSNEYILSSSLKSDLELSSGFEMSGRASSALQATCSAFPFHQTGYHYLTCNLISHGTRCNMGL